jgi:stage III sporulation protein AA
VGICGKAVYEGDNISNIRNINGINIRVAREMPGVSSGIIPRITAGKKVMNTVLISPPGGGKTTVLRDMARNFGNTPDCRPVLIDSRYELAAEHQGKLGLDVGRRTLVLSGYRKSDGFSHAIRNLSPDIILCDEIDRKDITELFYAATCGVSIVVTAHGSSLGELKKKMDISLFRRVVLLSGKSKNAQIFSTDGE